MVNIAVRGDLFGDARKAFVGADEQIGRTVMRSQCDILTGTLNSMGRFDIMEQCPIETVIINECAQASLSDIAIPFCSFQKTSRRAVMGDDNLQLGSFLVSERTN